MSLLLLRAVFAGTFYAVVFYTKGFLVSCCRKCVHRIVVSMDHLSYTHHHRRYIYYIVNETDKINKQHRWL